MIPIPLILQTCFGLYIANHILSSLCSQGPEGEGGPQGTKGDRGPQGADGHRGPQGIKGLQGHEGERGLKGFIGIMGVQGAQGPQGAQGERGIPGLPGERGTTKTLPSLLRGDDNNNVRGIINTPRKTVTEEATDLILANKIKKQRKYLTETPTKDILFKGGLSGSFAQVNTSTE